MASNTADFPTPFGPPSTHSGSSSVNSMFGRFRLTVLLFRPFAET